MSPTKRATHSLDSGITVVPAFIVKLWKLVEDPSCNHLICWSTAETSFIIKNQADFAKELLPHYFKHSNLASFIRQLNFYGFHKVASTEGRNLQHEKDEIEFFHPFFIRQQKGLLCLIKRKVAKGEDAVAPDFQDLLTDIKTLQGKQDAVDSLLSEMKQENQVLWQEVAQLREKHAKQQRIVAKLIHFLATLVQPKTGTLSIKRKAPLMIDVKKSRLSSLERIIASKKLKQDVCLAARINYRNASSKLNTIHDKESNDLTIHDVTSDSINTQSSSASQTDYVVESPLGDITDNGNIGSPCSMGNTLEPLVLLEPLESSEETLGLPGESAPVNESDISCADQNGVTDSRVTDPSTSVCQLEISAATLNEKVKEDTDVLLDKERCDDVGIHTQLAEQSQLANEEILGLAGERPSVNESEISCAGKNSLTDSRVTSPSASIHQLDISAATWNEEVNEDANVLLDKDQCHDVNIHMQVAEQTELAKTALSEHVQYTGHELDWLHEQLSQDKMNIGTSDIVLKLFSSDDDTASENPLLDIFPSHKPSDGIIGSEVLPCLSTPLDFSVLDDPLDDSLPDVDSSVGTSSTI